MANLPTMDEAAPLPISMSREVFEDTEDPRCFVLMPGDTTMQRLLTGQEDSLNGVGAAGKDVRMVHVGGEGDTTVMEEDKGLENMLGMKDDKMEMTGTVEVVHVEGGKTLEVMHIDTGKPVQVIHIEGGGKLDFLGGNREDNVSAVVPSRTRKGQQNTQTPVRRVVTTTQTRHHVTPALRSLNQPVTQPIIVSTGKSSLAPSHTYCHLPPVAAFPPNDKSQNIATHGIGSNIIISGTKEVLGDTEDALDNAIIISWPSIPQQRIDNTVGTQTDPYDDSGSGLNLFFCTFHADGSVETYCDFPAHHHKCVSTENRTGCKDRMKMDNHYSKEEENGLLLAAEEEEDENEEMKQAGQSTSESCFCSCSLSLWLSSIMHLFLYKTVFTACLLYVSIYNPVTQEDSYPRFS